MTTSNQHFLIRNQNLRNQLLKDTDYLMLPDVYEKLTEEQKQDIRNYRETLRNFININRDKYLIDGVSWIEFEKPPSWTNIKIPKY